MPERIILDSSVIIAAALKPKGPTRQFLVIVDEAIDIEIIWSQKLGYELHEKLCGEGALATIIDSTVKSSLLEWLEERANLVEDIKLDNPLPLSHDRDDDYLIALARHEKAQLVTLDSKLIASGPSDVKLVRPSEFISHLTDLS